MRFGLKVFFSVLLVFILALDGTALLMARHTYAQNLKRDTQRALSEHYVITGSLRDALAAYESPSNRIVQDKNRLISVMQSFAAYYRTLGAGLELFRGDELVYSSAPDVPGERGEVAVATASDRASLVRTLNGMPYLFVAGLLPAPYDSLTLVYARDLSELEQMQNRLNTWFAQASAAICVVLAVALFLLVRRLTRPIRLLEYAASDIARGDYAKRIALRSRDELEQLGERFNEMAESVERHIAELADEAKRREAFSDNLAHELRTPLTSIRGFAASLRRSRLPEEDRSLALMHIECEAVHLADLSDKLMVLAGLREGKPQPEAVDAAELCAFAERSLSALCEESGVRIETTLAPNLPQLYGDHALLESLLMNLVKNAIQASKTGDAVEIVVFAQAGKAVLEVRDHGMGMTADQLAHAADPFFRVDASRSRKSGGAGLGLSLCVRIAEAHGASLALESVPGQGTTARIYNLDTIHG